jgi:hypothetical protein
LIYHTLKVKLNFNNYLIKILIFFLFKADVEVIRLLESNKLKLEHLNLENCKLIFEYCIEIVIENMFQTIQYFNIQNISAYISEELIEKILFTCNKLRYFHVNNLADVIHKSYIKSIFTDQDNYKELLLKLKIVHIDPETNLKRDQMNSIAETCPELKSLIINCTGSRSCLENLANFKFLTELLVANLDCSLTYSFGGVLIEALKTSFGKQLRTLHLCHITDVNLRSIAKYCSNLINLNIEFLSYYEPVIDNYNEIDLNNNYKKDPIIESLRHLTIKNHFYKIDQVHSNLDKFKNDICLLLRNGKVNFLQLSNFNDLDDNFFQLLISNNFGQTKCLLESIETLILEEINMISSKPIFNYLFNTRNSLKHLNLIKCKSIHLYDFNRLKYKVKNLNLDCEINWK